MTQPTPRQLALTRLATTAEQDARMCDDDALVPGHSRRTADRVQRALLELARELRERDRAIEQARKRLPTRRRRVQRPHP